MENENIIKQLTDNPNNIYLERHVTLDHTMWGTDQSASLEVHAMDLLSKRLRDITKMLGGKEKVVTASEIPVMKKLRG